MNQIDNAVIQSFKIFLALCYSLDFALPYSDDTPSKGFQLGLVTDIAGNIALNLRFPKLDIGLWQPEILATLVPMPEASIDKNDGLV